MNQKNLKKSHLNLHDLVFIIIVMSRNQKMRRCQIVDTVMDEYQGCYGKKTVEKTIDFIVDTKKLSSFREISSCSTDGFVFTRKLEIIICALAEYPDAESVKEYFGEESVSIFTSLKNEADVENLRKTRGMNFKKYESLQQALCVIEFMANMRFSNLAMEKTENIIAYYGMDPVGDSRCLRRLKKQVIPAVVNIEIKCSRGCETKIKLKGLGRKHIFECLSEEMIIKLLNIQKLVYTGAADEIGLPDEKMLDFIREKISVFD